MSYFINKSSSTNQFRIIQIIKNEIISHLLVLI